MKISVPSVLAVCWLGASLAGPADPDLAIKEGLFLKLPRQLQRSVLAVDPVEMALASRAWRPPTPAPCLASAGER